MNQKGFINLVLIGVVALLVIGGGYFVWEKKNKEEIKLDVVEDVSDWKIYTNTEYGFEIELPNDWQVLVDKYSSSSGWSVYFNSPENVKVMEEFKNVSSGGSPDNITISYFSDVEKAASYTLKTGTFEEYLKNSQDQSYFIGVKKISFAGQTAFRGSETGMYDTDAIWIDRDNHLYKISLQNDRGMDAKLSAKILSTFKFTK